MRFLVALVPALALACSTPHARDVGNRQKMNPKSEFGEGGGGPSHSEHTDVKLAEVAVAGKKPRVLAHASANAIALEATRVYFGDAEDDGLFTVAKGGGDKQLLTRRAPTRDGLVVSDETIVWIASPGDTILRAQKADPSKREVVRQSGIFAQLAMDEGEIFFTEAAGSGGALTRVTGHTTAKLATFEGAPRGLAVDAKYAYVTTPARIVRMPRERGETEAIALGSGLAGAALDGDSVYATAPGEGGRVVVRVSKVGGTLSTIARGAANGPFAIHGGEVYFIDAMKPALRATSIAKGTTRIVADDPLLTHVTAMRADDGGVFLATGEGEAAQIVAIDR